MSPCSTAWMSFQDLVPLSIRNTFWHIDQDGAGAQQAESLLTPQPSVARAMSAPAEGWTSGSFLEGLDEDGAEASEPMEDCAPAAEASAAVWSQPCPDRLVTFDPLEEDAFWEDLRQACDAAARAPAEPCKPPAPAAVLATTAVATTWPIATEGPVAAPCAVICENALAGWGSPDYNVEGARWAAAPQQPLQPLAFGPDGCTVGAVFWQPAAVGCTVGLADIEGSFNSGIGRGASPSSDDMDGKAPKSRRRDRVVQLSLSGDNAPVSSSRTTVMLQNLPNNYSREMMMELLDREGFAKRYNFLYLPIDFRTHAAVGYAFINLVTPEDAERLHRRFEGFARWAVPSGKRCTVGWSHPHQGLDSNVKRYRNSPLMHELVPDSYRPILLRDGRRVAFPAPTKKIKPPRQGTERMLI